MKFKHGDLICPDPTFDYTGALMVLRASGSSLYRMPIGATGLVIGIDHRFSVSYKVIVLASNGIVGWMLDESIKRVTQRREPINLSRIVSMQWKCTAEPRSRQG